MGYERVCQRDTLIRYVLDELQNYEECHIDALRPLQVVEKDSDLQGTALDESYRESLSTIRQDLTTIISCLAGHHGITGTYYVRFLEIHLLNRYSRPSISFRTFTGTSYAFSKRASTTAVLLPYKHASNCWRTVPTVGFRPARMVACPRTQRLHSCRYSPPSLTPRHWSPALPAVPARAPSNRRPPSTPLV